MALRTPKLPQPLTKAEPSEARYAESRSASRTASGGGRRRGRAGAGPHVADEHRHHEGGQQEHDGVHQERHPQPEPAEQAAEHRPEDRSEQEGGAPAGRDPAPDRGRGQPHDQGQRRDREHGGADPAEAAEHQQLRVAAREGRRGGRAGDQEQTGQVDRTLTDPDDEPAPQRCAHQPEEREGADHHRRRRGADTEALRELRQHGRDQPEPHRHQERGGDQDPDLAGDPVGPSRLRRAQWAWRAAVRRDASATSAAVSAASSSRPCSVHHAWPAAGRVWIGS